MTRTLTFYVTWLIAGLAGGAGLVWYADRQPGVYRQRVYGGGLVIAAAIYVVFGLMYGDPLWIVVEFAGVAVYALFVYFGRRISLLYLAAGWLLHPLWDIGLHLVGPASHVAPDWYAVACLSFDVLVAAAIYRLYRQERAG